MLVDLSLPLDADDLFLKEFEVRQFGHIGTHLDWNPDISLDLSRFISPGKLIDVRAILDNPVDIKALRPDSAGVTINRGDFVIIRTGWLARTYGQPEYFNNGPELTPPAIEFLASLQPNMIAVDAPGLARRDRHSQVDRYLAECDIPVVENITGTGQLPVSGFTIYCFPLTFTNLSGLPVRLLADCPE